MSARPGAVSTIKRRAVGGLLALLLLSGCYVQLNRARVAYSDGRYLEVAETLAAQEHTVSSLPVRRQAEYGMYRGLSLLQLGDPEGAHRWLAFSYDVIRRAPESLSHHQLRALNHGWKQLERLGVAQPQRGPQSP